MKTLLFIFGTRPEAIKCAPIILAFQNAAKNAQDSQDSQDSRAAKSTQDSHESQSKTARDSRRQAQIFRTKICITAQHREMLDSALAFFQITPDYDLNIMRENQNLFDISSAILCALREVLEDCKPDFIFVHGDTTSALIAALGGFYAQIPVCHIEAGLRSFARYNPFPEELNRTLISRLASFHFAPTKLARQNLLRENISKSTIKVVGNSVIDALFWTLARIKSRDFLSEMPFLKPRFILVTAHRRESFGRDMEEIALALRDIAKEFPKIHIIYPLHPNPRVQAPMRGILGECANIFLIAPLDYARFVFAMSRAFAILTDSGGIQEEASALRKPTLILRNVTERKEALESPSLRLIGTNRKKIVRETSRLILDKKHYKKMANPSNPAPFGEGNTSAKILKFMQKICES